MQRRSVLFIALAGAAGAAMIALPSRASSHREAPFLTQIPKADGADFYMFNSYEAGRQGYVTLIADYFPAQEPGSGPNFYPLDSDVLYEINIDNDGSGKAGMVFTFRFARQQREASLGIGDKQVAIPLRQFGPIKAGDNSKLNDPEVYNLSVHRGGAAFRANGGTVTNIDASAKDNPAIFIKPADNLGAKTIPDYDAYAKQYVYNIKIPGCEGSGRVFVGQRKDPFHVNISELFDLVNLDPVGPMDQGKDNLANANITSFVLEAPAKCLAGGNKVIGGWTTAFMKRSRIGHQAFLPKKPTADQTGADDDWVQVSRLGMPLVNEVVIGLKDKDRFNSSEPKDDAQFLDYVTNPTLPALLQVLFADKGVKAPTAFPRKDLVTVFLTGIPGVNANGATAEMIRLNVTTPVTPAASQSNLGVLGKDNAGFPNGRRPGDDVVDISLRVAMGVLLPVEVAPSGQLPFTDGAIVQASFFDEAFPYLRAPLAGSPQGDGQSNILKTTGGSNGNNGK